MRTALNARGSRWVSHGDGTPEAGSHCGPGNRRSELDSRSYLEKTYPKDERQMSFLLARPNLLGDQFGRPVRAFLAGLMLLAGLILLAACANLGSLFAARAADRSREVALRLALGSSRKRILRGLFTEAVLISLVGGAVGLWASVALLRWLSVWQPFGNFPMHAPVTPDATVYGVALLLSLVSGFLFGAVPVSQVLRTNPYEVVKVGVGAHELDGGLLPETYCWQCKLPSVPCWSLRRWLRCAGCCARCTAISVLNRENAMLVGADLHMAGYDGDRVPPMQKRMIDAIAAIPGVESVGLTDGLLLNEQDQLECV